MDLLSLKAALKPLTKFGQEEHTFDCEGTDVTLRPLLPKEEMECQKRAVATLKEVQESEELADNDTLTRTAALHYFDQFRIQIISYALVQIGDVSFRGIETVETGEKLENGKAIRVPLQKALHQIISAEWSRGMITITFAKYGDLIAKISERADRVARDSIADLDAEIERVEARLKNLRVEREGRAKGDPSVTTQHIASLVQAGARMEEDIARTIGDARADRAAAAAIRRAAENPDDVDEVQIAEPAPEPAVAAPVTEPVKPARKSVVPPSAPPPTTPHRRPNEPQFRSSFDDAESPDSQAIMDDQMQAEAIRQARLRAATEARVRLEGEADARTLIEGEASDLSLAILAGTVDGKEAYRLPTETLSPRGVKNAVKSEVDPDPRRGTVNPHFKRPGS